MTLTFPTRSLPAILPRIVSRLTGITRLARLGVAALAATVVAACEPGGLTASGPATGPDVDPRQPVTVALLVPGGTGNANLDWLARSLANAGRMAAGDAQGATIDLRIYQSGADPATAVARAQEAVAGGAKIIIGPLHAEAANAVGHAVMPADVNVLAFSNNPEIAGGNVFILGNSFDNTAERLVRYGIREGKRRFVIVSESDLAGQIGARAIKAAIARNRATLVAEMPHQVSQAGIDAVVPGVAAAARGGQTDVVFLTANNDAVLPYISDALLRAGVNPGVAQMMGLTRWDQPAERMALPGVQNGLFAVPDMARLAAFEARYRAAYGEAPHPLAGLAYDGVAAVAAGLRAGRSNAVNTAGLTQRSGFQGVTGVFRLNRDGTNSRALGVATIRGNQLVILDPAPQGAGGIGY